VPPCELVPSMLAGGGTTCGVRVPAPDLASAPPLDTLGGGGTGLVRKSPVAALPQLLRSRLTCDGGGAMTAGAGSVSLGVDEISRAGAETGGAITSTVGASGMRELAKSCGASLGAGAMTVAVAIGFALRILSRETFGAGGITSVVRVLGVRLVVRFTSELNSGDGGTAPIVIAGRAGAMREERRPSAGGGPGSGLKASRLATAASECGRFSLGASTTFSVGLSPRATRMVCVRWCACWPPARPDLPAWAPPRSCV